jgi:hypothetical protein
LAVHKNKIFVTAEQCFSHSDVFSNTVKTVTGSKFFVLLGFGFESRKFFQQVFQFRIRIVSAFDCLLDSDPCILNADPDPGGAKSEEIKGKAGPKERYR